MADNPKWCCSDIRAAEKDNVIKRDPQLSICLIAKGGAGALGLIPISFCPWCGREQPKTLYTSPSMVYRP